MNKDMFLYFISTSTVCSFIQWYILNVFISTTIPTLRFQNFKLLIFFVSNENFYLKICHSRLKNDFLFQLAVGEARTPVA